MPVRLGRVAQVPEPLSRPVTHTLTLSLSHSLTLSFSLSLSLSISPSLVSLSPPLPHSL